MKFSKLFRSIFTGISCITFFACNDQQSDADASSADTAATNTKQYISQPLIPGTYTADPSARVFNNRIYIYPSHDTSTGTLEDDLGSHFDMRDYHVYSMDSIGGSVTDHGKVLDIKDVAWAGRQMWAPDAAFANNTYYLYFPVKDKQDIFRIGVATSNKPEGPFKPEAAPIEGSYSIDPTVFRDDNGTHYMYFGGIWGGQLQRWNNNKYDSAAPNRKSDENAVQPRFAKMNADMKSFDGPVKELSLVDSAGNPFKEQDNTKRFFEGPWMHKYKGKYYLSYSTGDTHNLCYATSDSPEGPFKYQGVIMEPVEGWTTHHSIVESNGKWYLFYHDVQMSGKTHLRNIKVTPLYYNDDGTIQTIKPFKQAN